VLHYCYPTEPIIHMNAIGRSYACLKREYFDEYNPRVR
jgi:hypothetical protein